jgi:Carboxypeptidase regulatory-like domain
MSQRLYPLIWVLLPLWIALGQDSRIGQIAGSVEDPTSAVIAEASVTLLSLNRVVQTRSNSDGAFRFEKLEPGVYAIEITAPGFAKKTIPVTLQRGHLQETISVVLNVGNVPDMEKCGRDVSVRYEGVDATRADLTGTLRDYFDRKPIARAEIAIVSESGQAPPVVVQSDATGQFSVSHLASDFYEIRISCKGYEREELKHVAMPRENQVLVESTLRKRKQMVACQ